MKNIEPSSSTENLLKAVEQMSLPELERFIDQVIAIKAHLKAPHLPQQEARLLERINQGLFSESKMRLAALEEKRDAEIITEEELEELIRLTDQLEEMHAGRLEAIAELARLRGISLSAMMQQLGITFPDHV